MGANPRLTHYSIRLIVCPTIRRTRPFFDRRRPATCRGHSAKVAQALDGYQAWSEDLESVVDMYRCLFEPDAIGIRLHILRSAMCPRFHVDRVPTRLLVTYSGRGTEWLPENYLSRELGTARLPDQSANDHQIEEIPLGAVAILKGTAWEGNENHAVAHRSPDPSGQPRLVLGLDWVA